MSEKTTKTAVKRAQNKADKKPATASKSSVASPKIAVKKTASKTAATKKSAPKASKPAVKKESTKPAAAKTSTKTAVSKSTKSAAKKPATKTENKTAVKKEENIKALTSTFGLPASVEKEGLKKPKITPRKNPAKAKAEKSAKSEVTFDSIKKASKLKAQSAKSTEVAKSSQTSTSKKLINSLRIIENISHTLGISDRERITFDIEEISPNELRVRIVNGTKNFKSPWFAIKNEEPYIFMPAEILDMVFRMLRTAQKESFELRLERSIWQHMPIDFGDVWRVAMDELARGNFAKEPDLEKLIAKIKQEHPNLFVDMTSFIAGE